ncbi:MAG TPA: glycolate oxidase subunit GlcE [Gammaproteobacteria bacterium]|nr:glycolate oxidase subunit GlcE [Gammaproteobacteria bacterium]
MAKDEDLTEGITEAVRDAVEAGTPLCIRGGGTKDFYGRAGSGEPLNTTAHRGIVNYEPTELVLTARAGTPLLEIERALAAEGQMLSFEPPHFDGEEAATLGGAVACGLSGPRRAFGGALRDMVLGTRVINGRGKVLRFGGEVMKNVAGYDVSRLMAGALGTLGVILEVSLKVLPRPPAENSLTLECPPEDTFARAEGWLRQGIPVSGTFHDGQHLHVRLSGTESAVESGTRAVGGERVDDAPAFWRRVRDQQLPFFDTESGPPLWRIALPPGSELPAIEGPCALEWAGKLAWVRSGASPGDIRHEAERLGGHATLFRGGDREGDIFHPLSKTVAALHERLKASFDPDGIFNPGRLYNGL